MKKVIDGSKTLICVREMGHDCMETNGLHTMAHLGKRTWDSEYRIVHPRV